MFAYDPNLAGGALFFQINNGADGSAYTTRSYTSLSWINICVVFDGSQATNQGKLKVYIDGVLENLTYGYTVPSSTSGTNWSSYFGTYAASSGWDLLGNIAFAHIYNRSLTAAEVLQNYNATKNRFI